MKLYNIVKVYTSTVGTGTVTLGSAVPSFITFATAGVVNGSTVSYAIEDGNNREVGTGTYTSGTETLTRNVVTSTNSNNLITLSGNAVVFITGLAADLSSDTANVASTLIQRDGSGNFAAGAATLSSAVVPLISGGTTASSTLTLQSTSGAGTSDAIIFRTASQLERMRVSTAGDVNIGSANNAGNTLRYFDVYNTNTGSSAGVITRLITSDVAGTGAAIGQIIKYKNGTMLFQNSETDLAASMQFYVGASERMRIDSSGRVGIALVPTTSSLEVNGEMAAVSAFAALRLMQTVTGTGYRWALNNDGTLRLQYTTNAFSTASIPILIDSAGNVGIGTSSPSTYDSKLAVNGNIGLTTIGQKFYPYYISATNNNYISSAAGGEMVFGTGTSSPSERMRIDSSGNVGIGTASPASRLNVRNTSLVADAGIVQLLSRTDGPYLGIGHQNWDGTHYAAIGGVVTDGSNNTLGALRFFTRQSSTDANLTERMRIDSSGNVGIGTSSPGTKLDILGANGTTQQIYYRSSDTNWYGRIGQIVSGNTIGSIISSGGAWSVSGATFSATKDFNGSFPTAALYIGNQYNSALETSFRFLRKAAGSTTTDGAVTELMTIDNSGNVGIGTSSITSRLTVASTSTPVESYRQVAGNGSNSNAFSLLRDNAYSGGTPTNNDSVGVNFRLKDSSGNYQNVGGIRGLITDVTGTGAGSLSLATKGASDTFEVERMRISSSGLVGIGKTGPTAAIDVLGPASTTAGRILGNANAAIVIDFNASGDNYYDASNHIFRSVGGSPERMRIDSSGNVGIGTSSPARSLVVRSNSSAYGMLQIIQTATNGEASIGFRDDSDSDTASWVIGKNLVATNDSFAWYYNGTKMTLLNTGELGIGTASPSYQLQLSTDSAAKPTTNTWTIASDSRLKTVKGEYQKGLAEICQVRPVRYEYNGKAGFIADGKDKVSILAQELMQVFPECVDTFKGKLEEDGPEIDLYNYNGHAITFALINAIKELKAEIDILKARN